MRTSSHVVFVASLNFDILTYQLDIIKTAAHVQILENIVNSNIVYISIVKIKKISTIDGTFPLTFHQVPKHL